MRSPAEYHGTFRMNALYSSDCWLARERPANQLICLDTATQSQDDLAESGLPLSPMCSSTLTSCPVQATVWGRIPETRGASSSCWVAGSPMSSSCLWHAVCHPTTLRPQTRVSIRVPPSQDAHPEACVPHVGQASPSPSTSPGQCREA